VRVSDQTAKSRSGRVIAIGTSVVRALESAANTDGQSVPEGAERANASLAARRSVLWMRSSPAHQPGESHYELLRAFADDRVLDSVRAAVEERDYGAHEFGDSLLIERQVA
jgi:S-adenosylmethionine:tRNA ribosyltransferase-isomerase